VHPMDDGVCLHVGIACWKAVKRRILREVWKLKWRLMPAGMGGIDASSPWFRLIQECRG